MCSTASTRGFCLPASRLVTSMCGSHVTHVLLALPLRRGTGYQCCAQGDVAVANSITALSVIGK